MQTIWLECIQERNEIIFVPSGWYHQVCNLVRLEKNLTLLMLVALLGHANSPFPANILSFYSILPNQLLFSC